MASDDVFEYTGRGCRVPIGVTHARCHPSVTEVIGFRYSELREVVLNEGLTTIGEEAFRHCIALQSINIPSTITKIGKCAFSDCIV